ncbi:MAG: hypothetical protein ACLQSR_02195 [Limisphaerales bacterium]
MKINLPAMVLDYASTNVPEPKVVLDYLPTDTSYAERMYTAPDGFWVQGTVVLMGTDRTSIHNADYCLAGTGYNQRKKSITMIPIGGLSSNQLSVSRWDLSGVFQQTGGPRMNLNGVYVFWFVANGDETPSHLEMMWKLAKHLAKTGVMQRWAYVSYFSPCQPGQEDAAFERMKRLIAASVPDYQLPLVVKN